jgi:hypothetical protein
MSVLPESLKDKNLSFKFREELIFILITQE